MREGNKRRGTSRNRSERTVLVRAELEKISHAELKLASPWIAGISALNAVMMAFVVERPAPGLVAIFGLLALAFGVLAVCLRRTGLQSRFAEPAAAAILMAALVGYFVDLYTSPVVVRLHGYALILILFSSGAALLSPLWTRLVLATALGAGAAVIAGMQGRLAWMALACMMLGSAATVYLVVRLRRRTITSLVLSRDAARSRTRRTARQVRRLELALQAARDGVWEWDCLTEEVSYSQAWRTMLGYAESDECDTLEAWLVKVDPRDRARVRGSLQECRRGLTESFECEYRVAGSGETPVWLAASGLAVRDKKGRVTRIGGSQWDITRLKLAEERLREEAKNDPLTGLYNRSGLLLQFERALEQETGGSGLRFAALFIDLDRFKEINDQNGHAAGDELLRSAARRIEACIGADGFAARYGGDEFVVVLRGRAADRAPRLARQILTAIRAPFVIHGRELDCSASIGVAISATPALPSELIRRADVAMYRAKNRGRNRIEELVPDGDRSLRSGPKLARQAELAIENREFELVYQPVIRLADGRIAALEALLRWRRGDFLLAPGGFLAALESSAVMPRIGAWTLREACGHAQAWRARGVLDAPVVVNFSRSQLADASIVDDVSGALSLGGLDPRLLEVDIPCQALEDEDRAVTANLRALARLSVRLALDDFQPGFLPPDALASMPWRSVKIRRPSRSTARRKAIDPALVERLRLSGLHVVAKGVELRREFESLRDSGWDAAQGFFIAEPTPSVEIPGLLARLGDSLPVPNGIKPRAGGAVH